MGLGEMAPAWEGGEEGITIVVGSGDFVHVSTIFNGRGNAAIIHASKLRRVLNRTLFSSRTPLFACLK